jgi:hypothetical protein
MSESITCKICGAGFREEAVKEGKCDMCTKLYPKANSLQEARELKNPKIDRLNEGHMHKVIAEKVYDILVNEGILTECECGSKFFKSSPAKKKCGKCPKK